MNDARVNKVASTGMEAGIVCLFEHLTRHRNYKIVVEFTLLPMVEHVVRPIQEIRGLVGTSGRFFALLRSHLKNRSRCSC